MKLSAPKKLTWLIAVLLGLIGIVAHLVPLGIVSCYSFWILAVGMILLVLSTAMKGF